MANCVSSAESAVSRGIKENATFFLFVKSEFAEENPCESVPWSRGVNSVSCYARTSLQGFLLAGSRPGGKAGSGMSGRWQWLAQLLLAPHH